MKYQVRNWREFQHYRDRNPPWIKLHFSLLTSADWVTLSDASRTLAVACMLVASRNNGEIDGSEAGLAYLHRVAYLHQFPDVKPLIDCGFLWCASKTEHSLQSAIPEIETETETEIEIEVQNRTEKEIKTKPTRKRAAIRPSAVSEQVWNDFMEIRKAKRAPMTDTALEGIEREAGKAGLTLQAALEMSCARGWQGFQAGWVNGSKPHADAAAEAKRRIFGEESDVTDEAKRL